MEGTATGTAHVRPMVNYRKQPRPTYHYNVLFLCTDNSTKSIMAEALLNRFGGEDFHAHSAGVDPRGEIDPLAVELMKTHRVWHPSLEPKGCHKFLAPDAPRMDFIITLGERRPARLPESWPGSPQLIHWRITEAPQDGEPAKKHHSLRKAFAELETRIRLFVLVHQHATMHAAPAAA